MIIHCSFTMLIILIPHTVVTVVIHKIIDTFSMLLILEPLSFVFFSIGKHINSISFTFPLHIFSFKDITVFKDCFSFSIRFSSFHFSRIDTAILKSIVANLYFSGECIFNFSEKSAFFSFIFLCHHSLLCKKSQQKCSI